MKGFHDKLCELAGSEAVKTGEPMSRHTTFRIGGPAAYFVTPKDEDSLRRTIDLCRREDMPYYILGNGSNLLVSDEGYEGVILWMGKAWNYCRADRDVLTVGAGTLMYTAARAALSAYLSGFEFAAGIPGTVGGAMVMNAGAYGFELKDVLTSARVMDADGNVLKVSSDELKLGYRHSCISENGWTALEAALRLRPGKQEDIKALMEELGGRRREKQPLEYPSAGSTFKRPAGHFAGKLIDEAGLKGFRVGGAQISEKHCGFVINRDHATAADVMALCRQVRERVRERSGVELVMEVKTLGNF